MKKFNSRPTAGTSNLIFHEVASLSLYLIRVSGLACSLYKCVVFGELSVVILQLNDPLAHFIERRKFLPASGFPSDHNMTTNVDPKDTQPEGLPEQPGCGE